jgi:hypothetical protein
MLESKDIDYKTLQGVGQVTQDVEKSTLVDDPEVATHNYGKLQLYRQYWYNLSNFRARRERSRKFYRGDQWHDEIVNPDTGQIMREDEYIASRGKTPLKNNKIRPLVKTLIGQYRENDYKPIARAMKREHEGSADMMSNLLQYILEVNEIKELDARNFEEYLISGFFGWRVSFEWMMTRNMNEVTVYKLNPTRMFWNTDIQDPRLIDMRLVGEIHDLPIESIMQTFGKNKADYEKIREWYSDVQEDSNYDTSSFGSDYIDNLDFFVSQDSNKGRVFEVWEQILTKKMFVHDTADGTISQTDYTQEDIDIMNTERMAEAVAQGVDPELVPLMFGEEKMEYVWYYKFLTRQGNVLAEGETPYDHESHPFCINLYPMVDGEVWGFIEDIIDIQQSINRNITTLDFMNGAAAKGVLMVPQELIPEGMSEADFAAQWTRFDGMIVYKAKPGVDMPKQITANSQSAGIQQMIQFQLQELKDESGVNEALSGQKIPGVNTASQYAQMSNNASLSSKDYFEKFFSGRKNRDFKLLQMAQQFYDETRYINIVGKDYNDPNSYYDPEKGRDGNFDIIIGRSSNSPVYRDLIEENLKQFLAAQFIDFETYLDNTTMPYADKMRQQFQQKQQEMMEAQQQNGVPLEGGQQALPMAQ